MKRVSWQVLLGLTLLILSIIFYLLHYLIFRDYHHIFIYLIGDVAFVFIEVLLVTLIIHQLLNKREKRSRLEKLNMVIGAFFSEVGTELLTYLSDFDPKLDSIREELILTKDFTDREFSGLSKRLKSYDYGVDREKVNLEDLRGFLVRKMDFLLRLLENPNLLEHESFTELLWAVFHLTEELAHRKDVSRLPDTDRQHLIGDINRVYGLLVNQWFDYMKHLKGHYPYLYSLAMRINPFDQEASPIVQ
ncbi:MAG: hypothetical protein RAO92_09715 [Candidatus Euphemobacter frigidus]|nr:hypothetical protein [Candidatus Euphemobacter frigidus]MDP8276659.1 hypothetical protein [Candidatus Euphemobacter frigidus]